MPHERPPAQRVNPDRQHHQQRQPPQPVPRGPRPTAPPAGPRRTSRPRRRFDSADRSADQPRPEGGARRDTPRPRARTGRTTGVPTATSAARVPLPSGARATAAASAAATGPLQKRTGDGARSAGAGRAADTGNGVRGGGGDGGIYDRKGVASAVAGPRDGPVGGTHSAATSSRSAGTGSAGTAPTGTTLPDDRRTARGRFVRARSKLRPRYWSYFFWAAGSVLPAAYA